MWGIQVHGNINHEVGIHLASYMSVLWLQSLTYVTICRTYIDTYSIQISRYIWDESSHYQPTNVRAVRVLSAFSLKVHLLIQIKATVRFCHWNSSSTSAQRLSDLVRCPFFPDNYSPVLGFCPVPCCGGLAARIQLLLCEWQLIKALGFC